MPICYYCGREFDNLKHCSYCNQDYCEEHFPTNMHDCPLKPILNPYDYKTGTGNQLVSPEELGSEPLLKPEGVYYEQQNNVASNQQDNQQYTQPSNVQLMPTEEEEEDYVYTDGSYIWHRAEKNIPDDAFNPESGVEIPGILWPEKSELYHFVFASVLLLLLVSSGLFTQFIIIIIQLMNATSMSLKEVFSAINFNFELLFAQILVLSIFYLMSFLTHEFSHRQTARSFELQTKFRLFKNGVVMTIICLFLPVKFALPGAVVVLGLENINRETGLCKLAGPLSNVVLGSIMLGLALITYNISPWNYWLATGAVFNFTLGTFNMLPFGILDGENIKKWRPKLWLVMLIVLIALCIVSFTIQGQINSPSLISS
ncbi:MAG: hypothetical protein GF364_03750 [Candidatus Lokiarchaeota archaeon]|nr:hypothetical protein [Candidatus Lokiarchaeota archaeon]